MMSDEKQIPDYIRGENADDLDVLKKIEKTWVCNMRYPNHKEADSTKEIPLTGLALSGGGIRSATFNLGVLQALSKKGLLRKLDYLSTVSGGGYVGTSLSWFLSNTGQSACGKFIKETKSEDPDFRFGTKAENFPYGVDVPGKILTGSDSPIQKQLLNHLRNRGNYLAPGNGLTLLTLFGVVIRNSIVNLYIWLSLLTAVILGTILLFPPANGGEVPYIFELAGKGSAVVLGFFLCVGIFFAILTKYLIDYLDNDKRANQIREYFDRWGTHVLEVGIALVPYLQSLRQNDEKFTVHF